MTKPVILTGVRSNAEPTLGNLLGAILPMARMQQRHAGQYRINVFIPDLHSITTPTDYRALYESTLRNLRIFAAAGLDINNEDTLIYRQSHIPAHSELAWILDCFIYYGELKRMTQFKEKSDQSDSVSAGLFNYPALMAADILLYDANYIPVGEDQRQHIELTRDVALRMNNLFGELFTVPEVWAKQLKFSEEDRAIRIRSLKHPEQKMSKSISDPGGTILVTDDPEEARAKVLSATTDSLGKVNLDFDSQPGVSNLLQIIALIGDRPLSEVTSEWQAKTSYSELKQTAAEAVAKLLGDFQTKLQAVSDDQILAALKKGEAQASEISKQKLDKVQRAVGLREH